jgi:hypothetical protein
VKVQLTRFQRFSIQFIIITIAFGLVAAGFATMTAYGLVKITSPTKGQHVPVGNIIISGISSSNTTNHCTVSVIINGVKPYQQSTPAGSKTRNDYSNWTFTTSNNAINEGANKITAKYSCPQNANLTKFYSVNVTGVATKGQQSVPTIPPTPANNTKTLGRAFPPSLPSISSPIINESKPSNILKGIK